MFLFYVLSFFKRGDTIQEGTLFKGGHYLRKCGIQKWLKIKIQHLLKYCPGTLTKLEISKVNKIPFLCTKFFFQKRGDYSRGNIIQGGDNI